MTLPLSEKTIVITRDSSQSAGLTGLLEQNGATVFHFPTIRIIPPENWSACDQALARIDAYDWIFFSSANGVSYFMDRAREIGVHKIAAKIAVVGEKTREKLVSYGLTCDIMPTEFTAQGLLVALDKTDMKNKRCLLPSSDKSRDALAAGLQKSGAAMERLTVYRTGVNKDLDGSPLIDKINRNEIDCITFFSPSAVTNFAQIMGEKNIKRIGSATVRIAVIGPSTARAVADLGLKVDMVPRRSDETDLVDTLIDFFSQTH